MTPDSQLATSPYRSVLAEVVAVAREAGRLTQRYFEDRLALDTLAQRLSLTAGPLRLLDGDFPDRAFMAGIAEHNLRQALELLHV